MTDIIIEILRTIIVGLIVAFLISNKKINNVKTISGWNYILGGFILIFLGMVVDITDNFESLNRFILIGNTEYQAFFEKIAGYLLGFSLLAAGIWKWIPGIIELDRNRTEDLKKATSEIKILSGLLPICMDCKKIRDDTGYWNQIEHYISEHSEAELSHSICNDCINRRYPDEKD